MITSGDLPGLQYWQNSNGDYRVVAAVQRDDRGYVVVANKAIKEPKDLAGKTVATRVGSTGSWFVSEYLTKNKVDPASVTVKNLDPPNLPIALCRGDIDAFFIWQPNGWKAQELCGDKVFQLSNAVGYVRGYNILGARPGWLEKPENAEAATKFLIASRKGAEIAVKEFPEVAKYVEVKFGIDAKAAREMYDLSERVFAIDQGFFDDFCSISKWLQRTGGASGPSDLSAFIWPDALKKIDPKLVLAAPPPC
jgi:NitT/TauT family transport system substrate-binding protein